MNAATLSAVRNVFEVLATLHGVTFGRVGFVFTTQSGSKYAIVRDNMGRVEFDTDSASLPRTQCYGTVRDAVIVEGGRLVIHTDHGRITTSRVITTEVVQDCNSFEAIA